MRKYLKRADRSAIRKLLKKKGKIRRFELHTALGGVYEIYAVPFVGSRVSIGSETMKATVTNGINKLKVAQRIVRLLNMHWHPKKRK
jgi:hypothetical protein